MNFNHHFSKLLGQLSGSFEDQYLKKAANEFWNSGGKNLPEDKFYDAFNDYLQKRWPKLVDRYQALTDIRGKNIDKDIHGNSTKRDVHGNRTDTDIYGNVK